MGYPGCCVCRCWRSTRTAMSMRSAPQTYLAHLHWEGVKIYLLNVRVKVLPAASEPGAKMARRTAYSREMDTEHLSQPETTTNPHQTKRIGRPKSPPFLLLHLLVFFGRNRTESHDGCFLSSSSSSFSFSSSSLYPWDSLLDDLNWVAFAIGSEASSSNERKRE